ncbi:MAG: hypothetical protein ABID38_06210 [Candidatus Diapherotrites archaeon]
MSAKGKSAKDMAVGEIKKSVEDNIKSQKSRKMVIFAAIAILILILLVVLIASILPILADTCSNQVQDGDELAVDCGGSCKECDEGQNFILSP